MLEFRQLLDPQNPLRNEPGNYYLKNFIVLTGDELAQNVVGQVESLNSGEHFEYVSESIMKQTWERSNLATEGFPEANITELYSKLFT